MRQLVKASLALSFLISMTAVFSATASAQQLRIVHIDVGQGDATLIVGPARTLLFDGGVTGSGTEIRAVLDALGISSIDYFVAGHYHADHIGAIDEVINGGIALNLAAYDRGGSYSSQAFTHYTTAVGAKRSTITVNQQIDLGGGCVLTCVAVNGATPNGSVTPTDENARSVALVLRYGAFDYFIASDLSGGGSSTADVESLLASSAGDVDVLHVGHHGSTTSTNQTLVDTLKPEQAVISLGDGNSYGHPTQGVLDRLDAAATVDTIWQTEAGTGATAAKVRVGGDITFLTDGNTYSVNVSSTGQTYYYTTDGVHGAAPRVVINEVAWVGSSANSLDEWIELYNTTSGAISLTGWRIMDDGGAQTYNLSGTIAAGGYYLIERTANSTSVAGDITIAGLSLANTGDSLELQDAGGGRVDWVNYTGGAWFAGTTTGYYAMERKQAAGGGSTSANWAHNDGVTRNGTNSDGGAINGTPRAKNSVTP
jgi:beta-lactamase superfamily II metal-dependent hydrolase